MSDWAQSWAYEQRLGRWRETNSGKRAWKGDPGAKSVLAAVATFADEEGYAYCGQETLAEMTDMTERSRKSRPQRHSASCFSEPQTGLQRTLLPSNLEELAALKTEVQEKLLQNAALCSALGRTRTCDLLIRSQKRRVFSRSP